MAQRVQIILEDDLDGGAAEHTVLFGLDGAEYEIDLSEGNASKLRDALAPFVSHGRKTGGRRKRGTRQVAADLSAVRAWAASNGHKVSSRGRIPGPVMEAFQEAEQARGA